MNRKYIVVIWALLATTACKTTSKGTNRPLDTALRANSGASHNHQVPEAVAVGYADSVNSGAIATDTMKRSPRRVAMLTVGGCHVHIDYGSPGVKGRTIWGGLVAYNQVWSAGAHAATTLAISKRIVVNGTTITPGTYGFFAIPGKAEWILIINRNYKQHLADAYDPAEDVVRTTVTAVEHPFTPRLTYSITQNAANKGAITLAWDKLAVQLPFEVLP
ncbi:MAG: DUF2911 domain-containing protein [Bacteroidetes bacterium]|nr:MAG: DUF2911 domain-containing protein [Bacteroidota bacterium]